MVLLLLVGCRAGGVPARDTAPPPTATSAAVPPATPTPTGYLEYTVRPGDTLRAIAARELGAEDLSTTILDRQTRAPPRDRDRINVGQVLLLPVAPVAGDVAPATPSVTHDPAPNPAGPAELPELPDWIGGAGDLLADLLTRGLGLLIAIGRIAALILLILILILILSRLILLILLILRWRARVVAAVRPWITIRGHQIDLRIVALWQVDKKTMELSLQRRAAGGTWREDRLIHVDMVAAPSDGRRWPPTRPMTVTALNARPGRDVAVVRVVGRWLDDGSLELALRQRHSNGIWSEDLPGVLVVPPEQEEGAYAFGSPVRLRLRTRKVTRRSSTGDARQVSPAPRRPDSAAAPAPASDRVPTQAQVSAPAPPAQMPPSQGPETGYASAALPEEDDGASVPPVDSVPPARSIPPVDSVPPARSIPTADSIRDAYPYELHVLGPVALHMRRTMDDGSTELSKLTGIRESWEPLAVRLAIHASGGGGGAQTAADLGWPVNRVYSYTGKLRDAMVLNLMRAGCKRAEAVKEIKKLIVRSRTGQRFAADLVITDYDIMLQLGDEATQLHAQGRDDLALQVLSEALGLVRAEPLEGVKGSPWITALRAEIRDCVAAMAADAAEWAQAEGWAAAECEQFAAALHRLGPSSGPR